MGCLAICTLVVMDPLDDWFWRFDMKRGFRENPFIGNMVNTVNTVWVSSHPSIVNISPYGIKSQYVFIN